MVLQNKVNLLHRYVYRTDNNSIAVGNNEDLNTEEPEELKFYEKESVLTHGIKQLPVLKNMSAHFSFNSTLPDDMQNSGIEGIEGYVFVFNCEESELPANETDYWTDPKLLAVFPINIFRKYTTDAANGYAAAYFYTSETDLNCPDVSDHLLMGQLTIVQNLYLNTNVAGAGFSANRVSCLLNLEVDWVSVSEKELDKFIKEYLFARMS